MTLPVRRTVADHPEACPIDETDDDADALAHMVDAVFQDAPDVVVGDGERVRCNGRLRPPLVFTGRREAAAQATKESRRQESSSHELAWLFDPFRAPWIEEPPAECQLTRAGGRVFVEVEREQCVFTLR